MWTSPEKLTFFTLVYGLIQSRRLPSSPQNPSASRIDGSYMSWYLARSAQARFAQSSDTGNSIAPLVIRTSPRNSVGARGRRGALGLQTVFGVDLQGRSGLAQRREEGGVGKREGEKCK